MDVVLTGCNLSISWIDCSLSILPSTLPQGVCGFSRI